MKTLYVILTLIFAVQIAYAQPVRGTLSPAKKMKLADQIYERGDSYNALAWYESVYEDEPGNTEVLHKIATLQYELRDYERAESWYNRLVRRDKGRSYPTARFTYAKLLKINGNHEDAIEEFEEFLKKNEIPAYDKLAKNEIEGARMAMNLTAKEEILVANAGEGINSPSTEQAPLPYGDKLYYSSIRSDSVIVIEDPKQANIYAKMYVANKVKGGTWGTGKVLAGLNEVGFHTSSATVSKDGQTMYFTRCKIEGRQNCKIYRANAKGGAFGEARLIKLGESKFSYKHPAVGEIEGKEVLFFSSNMPGGFGGWDIYYTEMRGNDFTEPLNLGTRINTVGSEETPFYQEGALYFSTNGHPTIGGYDIYETAYVDGTFSSPVHMGPAVNSRTDDMFFSLSDDGYHGYLVSNRPGTISLKSETCCDDIYNLTFLDRIPYDVTAKIINRKTNEAVTGATVELFQVSPERKFMNVIQDTLSEYTFTLRGNRSYVFITTREGFTPDTTTLFNTNDLSEATTLTKKILLGPLPPPPPPPPPPVVITTPPPPPPVVVPDIVKYGFVLPVLDTIYFDFDKARIRSNARLVLDDIASKLIRFPQLVVEVASHTDSKGRNDYNYKLSKRRTNAAIKYLKRKGIDESRLVPAYYGEELPVAPNDTYEGKDNPEGRKKNRRTEFRILEGTNANGQIRIPLGTYTPTNSYVAPPSTSTPSVINNVVIEPTPIVQSTDNQVTKPVETVNPTPPPVVKKAQPPTDEPPVTVLTFDKNFHDFGTLKKGEKVSHVFKFTNTGTNDLLIEFASGSCGCTVPAWPEDPIPPGGTGEILVEFDSKDKEGEENQEVNIIANTDPIVTELKIKAVVE